MRQLVLLYWGCVFLMYLSQTYYPVKTQLDGRQTGKRHFLRRRADVFMVIVIAWMTCFSFLRTSYNDSGNYIYFFRNQSDSLEQLVSIRSLLKIGANPFFSLYQAIIQKITDNYHIFFLFPALLNSIVVIKFFKKYSTDFAFTLLIFHSIGTYVMYIAALKQCIAVAILLIALRYAIDKKYIKFFLLVFVAMLFHTHAFVFFAVPLFFEKPWGKVTWILLASVFVAMAAYDAIFSRFMNIASSLGINIVDWELFDGHSIHPLRIVVYWIPAILALIFRNRLFSDSTREENLFANLSIGAAFILTIGLRQGANLFARMAAYYEVVIGISLPWMIKKIFTKQSARVLTFVASVMYFGYFLYEFGVSKGFDSGYRAITIFEFFSSLFI